MLWSSSEVQRIYWTTSTKDATVKIFGRINYSYVVNRLESFWVLVHGFLGENKGDP
jgi:hypothetical protein